MTYMQHWGDNPGNIWGTNIPAFEMEMSDATGLPYIVYPYFWRVLDSKWGSGVSVCLMKPRAFWWPTIVFERELDNGPLDGYGELSPENIAYQAARGLFIHNRSLERARRIEKISGDYPPKKLGG